jgi:hypothetical protein
VPRDLLKSGVSKIHPIRAMTTTGNHLTSRWRSTSTMKRKTWSVDPLRLKAATSPKLVLITRWRTYSKHTTTRLNTPVTYTTTKGTKPINTTTPKAETLSASGRKARSLQDGTICTTPSLRGTTQGSGTP